MAEKNIYLSLLCIDEDIDFEPLCDEERQSLTRIGTFGSFFFLLIFISGFLAGFVFGGWL